MIVNTNTTNVHNTILHLHHTTMSVNNPGTIRRTRLDEVKDVQNTHRNMSSEAWKQWPNEAAVSPE